MFPIPEPVAVFSPKYRLLASKHLGFVCPKEIEFAELQKQMVEEDKSVDITNITLSILQKLFNIVNKEQGP